MLSEPFLQLIPAVMTSESKTSFTIDNLLKNKSINSKKTTTLNTNLESNSPYWNDYNQRSSFLNDSIDSNFQQYQITPFMHFSDDYQNG